MMNKRDRLAIQLAENHKRICQALLEINENGNLDKSKNLTDYATYFANAEVKEIVENWNIDVNLFEKMSQSINELEQIQSKLYRSTDLFLQGYLSACRDFKKELLKNA